MASMAQATKTEGALTYGNLTNFRCALLLLSIYQSVSTLICPSASAYLFVCLPLISLTLCLCFSPSFILPPSSFLPLYLSHTHSFHFSNFLCPKLNGAIEAPWKLKIYALGIDLIHIAPRVSHVHRAVFP